MPSLSYMAQFVEPLLSGVKLGTIRNVRRVPIREQQTLYHFYALRSKHCLRIGESKCISVEPITMLINSGVIVIDRKLDLFTESTVDVYKTDKELKAFAIRDGFKDWNEMKSFWLDTHGTKKGDRKVILVPYQGIYIRHTRVVPDPKILSSPFNQTTNGKQSANLR